MNWSIVSAGDPIGVAREILRRSAELSQVLEPDQVSIKNDAVTFVLGVVRSSPKDEELSVSVTSAGQPVPGGSELRRLIRVDVTPLG